MQPQIDATGFGSITIAGERIEHDVLIRLSGKVEKRRKKLSKAVYGTSHIVSLDEAGHCYEKGAERLIVGAGGHRALEQGRGRGDRAVPCDLLRDGNGGRHRPY